ncbi:hypothetical protein [Oscillatoria sp. FACHB-1406]|uniref:hypothetical protein n=1 Tax=Oscillatoria sp. FACHB-1406 TaxID=2692846 RepID=UPI0016839512|nr:hypothetical protein [Oscillatoria sp. FACHB-1406]MBD2577830.1 hypothetical protein [Oscillatoria sp. FACHB-1406]
MSKRRNPKKEKALRNKAYARRFRKSLNRGRTFRNKRYDNRPSGSDREDDNAVEDSSADAN